MTIRFVEVDVTEAMFAASDEPWPQLAPEIALADGERIISIEGNYRPSGTFGSNLTVAARVWIVTEGG